MTTNEQQERFCGFFFCLVLFLDVVFFIEGAVLYLNYSDVICICQSSQNYILKGVNKLYLSKPDSPPPRLRKEKWHIHAGHKGGGDIGRELEREKCHKSHTEL